MIKNQGIQIQYLSRSQLAATLSQAKEDSQALLLLEHSHDTDLHADVPNSLTRRSSGLHSITEKSYELWLAQGKWQHSTAKLGNSELSYSFNHNYLIGGLSIPLPSGESLEELSQYYYELILQFIARQGKPTPLRMWNYFPQINQVDHELERYQQFCIGRHNAFKVCAATAPEYPAASAVGCYSENMTILFIATESSGLFLENPNQISAYRYPRQYSPKSPSFARASIFQEPEVSQLYISGTASIVGHESRFHGDIINQTRQTLKNLSRLIEHTNVQETIKGNEFELSEIAPAIKVYLREPADRENVSPLIKAFAPNSDNICYLQADICRQELDIEIEMLLTTKNS